MMLSKWKSLVNMCTDYKVILEAQLENTNSAAGTLHV